MHEHFHQLQDSQPGLFQKIDELGLSHGDSSGMWMLNYPFPYEMPVVADNFAKLRDLLLTGLMNRMKPSSSGLLHSMSNNEKLLSHKSQKTTASMWAFNSGKKASRAISRSDAPKPLSAISRRRNLPHWRISRDSM
jgi:hypothetical protein